MAEVAQRFDAGVAQFARLFLVLSWSGYSTHQPAARRRFCLPFV